MDGSQKIPNRLLGTAGERLAAGAVPTSVALAERLRETISDTRSDARSITDAVAAELEGPL